MSEFVATQFAGNILFQITIDRISLFPFQNARNNLKITARARTEKPGPSPTLVQPTNFDLCISNARATQNRQEKCLFGNLRGTKDKMYFFIINIIH